MLWAEKILIAAVIVILTWILAKAAKWAFAKLVDKIEFLQRQTGSGESIGMSLGSIISLVIWLFGMLILLQHMGFSSAIKPLETLLTDIMDFIPNLLGAGIIFFIGLTVARIIRQLVETVLSTVDLDKWAAKGGVPEVTGSNSLTKTVATILFSIIMIVVSIGALGELGIDAVSRPATTVLTTVLNAIPLVIGAALILAIAYYVANWVGNLISEVMQNLGADRALGSLGFMPGGATASSVVSKIVTIAIMLFSAIAATRLLNFPELTSILNEILALGGKVLFGGVIIAAGVWISNLLSTIVTGTGDGTGAKVVRYSTMILFVAMGLKYMGVADSIIEMAFGALVIGTGVAFALAFGLGGRDAAARYLDKQNDAAAKPGAPKKAAAPKKAKK
ncbi:hypothetical protein LPB140_09920 [Sphingorhabdus lutea]|uniref:Small-conductance mechanosensitive channel n=2 Tax=Sphingorhabdus lutea TaxID=1913578 RepID=A0A1L3JF66_9SPHN|nr:hypothetical protein LPB140_09920 [Sphingorhabdus lutea]